MWTDAPPGPELATGREANVVVEEMPEGPSVPKLLIGNTSDVPVLLVEGELLEGGWQHRVLQHDVVIDAGKRMSVDVNCVEQGRWQGAAGHSRQARRAAPAVRSAMASAAPDERQTAVWEQVASYSRTLGPSATSSLLDHIDRLPIGDAATVRALPGQRGVAYGTGGYPVGIEVFATEAALRAHLEQILASVLVDVAARPEFGTNGEVPGRRVRRLVGLLDGLATSADSEASGGEGVVRRADTDKLLVRGITLDEHLVHLSVLDRRHPLIQV